MTTPVYVINEEGYRDVVPEWRKRQDIYYLQIGDCVFDVPPTKIQVRNVSQIASMSGIRQRNSIKTNAGHSLVEIRFKIWFNNVESINGCSISGPTGTVYYMDGLRPLIAQFRRTPILPVFNEFLNEVHNIWSVILSNIVVNTVPEFPDVLEAEVVLYQTTVEPFLLKPDYKYADVICWPLLRWYYQQLMNETHLFYHKPVGPDFMDGSFKFSVLNEEFLEKKTLDITKVDNLKEAVEQAMEEVEFTNDVVLESMVLAFGNAFANLQVQSYLCPSHQFLGSLDTEILAVFMTTNRECVAQFYEMKNICSEYAIDYHDKYVNGFAKFTNELAQLFGVGHVVIRSVQTETIEEHPGLFRVIVDMVEYDVSQQEREKADVVNYLEKEIPDAETIRSGDMNYVLHSCLAEKALDAVELYPDLELPSYREVDEAINSINHYFASYNLPPADYHPFIPQLARKNPSLFVDPDFYINYTNLDEDGLLKTDNMGLPDPINIPAVKASENKRGTSSKNKHEIPDDIPKYKSPDPGKVPDDVYSMAIYYGEKYRVPPAVFVGLGVAERGWSFEPREWIFDYGWTDSGQIQKFEGQSNQWNGAGKILAQYFGPNTPGTYENYLRFFRDGYRTTNFNNAAKNAAAAYESVLPLFSNPQPYYEDDGIIGPPVSKNPSDDSENIPIETSDPVSGTSLNPSLRLNYKTELYVPLPNKDFQFSRVNPTLVPPDQYLSMMCRDMFKHDRKGRLVQAFPTFLLLFIDEGRWSGGRRLWNKFYSYHSLISMSIVKDKHNPADIAYIELTNVYSTLNQRLIPKYLEKQGFWSRMFSVITEDVLEERTRVLNKLDVQAGCRVHIRMGYGSLASLLPIGFNGVIAEIEVGETIMYVAQGDGVELVNDISNYGPDQTNSMFNVGVEPTDIIRRIMCKRGWAFHLDLDLFSRFILKSNADAVNGEYAFGTSSPYGIEHFGMVQKDQDGLFDLFGEIKVYDIMKNIYTTGIDIANINKMWVEATRNTTTYDITNEDLQKSWWDQVGEYFQGLWGRTDQVADEPNIGVWLGNKTPWDIFQILAKCTDGYICTAFPHQFRSSLFFGLTWWLVSVGYKLKSDVDSIDSLPEGPAGWGTGGTSYGGR